jgi:hypothetical protein
VRPKKRVSRPLKQHHRVETEDRAPPGGPVSDRCPPGCMWISLGHCRIFGEPETKWRLGRRCMMYDEKR